MRHGIWMCALLALATGSAEAQRGGAGGMGGGSRGGMGGMGGGRGGMMPGGGAREPKLKFPSAKTVEKYNPAALLLDKRKKLSLTDAQVAQLKDLRQRIFERNAPVLAQYDSLQKTFRPPRMTERRKAAPGGAPDTASDPAADSTRRLAMLQMRQLRALGDSLLARRRTDVRDVTGVLSDDTQRIRANDFLVEQDADFSDEFPAPFVPRADDGARPQRGGGRGGRRPPPAGSSLSR